MVKPLADVYFEAADRAEEGLSKDGQIKNLKDKIHTLEQMFERKPDMNSDERESLVSEVEGLKAKLAGLEIEIPQI
jgi:hypothetical protein